jgi:hypothetical protein
MVTIGSKVPKPWPSPISEGYIVPKLPKLKEPQFTDLEKADLLECCATWQYAYKSKRQFPKTERMWLRIEELIKKLL